MAKIKLTYQVTVSGMKEFSSEKAAKDYARRVIDETDGDLTVEIESFEDD